MKQHKNPCHDCPWRRIAMPGWVGESMQPEDWVSAAHAEAIIWPVRWHCHLPGQCLQVDEGPGGSAPAAGPGESLRLTEGVHRTPPKTWPHQRGQPKGTMSKTIAKVWSFRSSSSTKVYQTLQYTDGTTSCECPGWTRRNNTVTGRTCKHTRWVEMGSADIEAASFKDYGNSVVKTSKPTPPMFGTTFKRKFG